MCFGHFCRPWKDRDDLETVASEPVGNHVRRARHDKFSRTGDTAKSAQIRQFGEALDGVEEHAGDSIGGFGTVARDVRAEMSQMLYGSGDETMITREAPFAHACAPTNGASSRPPCVEPTPIVEFFDPSLNFIELPTFRFDVEEAETESVYHTAIGDALRTSLSSKVSTCQNC